MQALLQGGKLVGWSVLFACLNIVDEGKVNEDQFIFATLD